MANISELSVLLKANTKQAQGQIDIEQLKDQLKVAEQTKRYKQVQRLSDELKRRGLSDKDISKLRSNAVEKKQLLDLLGPDAYAALEKQGKI